MTNDIPEVMKAWAAGVFDGEGCAVIEQITQWITYQTRISITNTDLGIIRPFIQIWNARLQTKTSSTGRLYYDAVFAHCHIRPFVLDILPYVKSKRGPLLLILDAILEQDKASGRTRVIRPFYEHRLETKYWGRRRINRGRDQYDADLRRQSRLKTSGIS